jgi:hypothetical protein
VGGADDGSLMMVPSRAILNHHHKNFTIAATPGDVIGYGTLLDTAEMKTAAGGNQPSIPCNL